MCVCLCEGGGTWPHACAGTSGRGGARWLPPRALLTAHRARRPMHQRPMPALRARRQSSRQPLRRRRGLLQRCALSRRLSLCCCCCCCCCCCRCRQRCPRCCRCPRCRCPRCRCPCSPCCWTVFPTQRASCCDERLTPSSPPPPPQPPNTRWQAHASVGCAGSARPMASHACTHGAVATVRAHGLLKGAAVLASAALRRRLGALDGRPPSEASQRRPAHSHTPRFHLHPRVVPGLRVPELHSRRKQLFTFLRVL